MYISQCCGSPALVQHGKEGTNFFFCGCCKKACNAVEEKVFNKNLDKRLDKIINDNQPQITKLSTTYKISHKGYEIKAEKSEDGRLTLIPRQTQYVNEGFVFKGSKPKTVRDIGEILIKCSEL